MSSMYQSDKISNQLTCFILKNLEHGNLSKSYLQIHENKHNYVDTRYQL